MVLDALKWLYLNVPNLQLQGSRTNVVSVFWLLAVAWHTYRFLAKNSPVEERTVWVKLAEFFACLGFGKAYHQLLDSTFMVLQFLSGNGLMLSGGDPAWSWMLWGFGVATYTPFAYFYMKAVMDIYKLKDWFRWNPFCYYFLFMICGVWGWFLIRYPYDYAVLSGSFRVEVYWATYPLVYGSYFLLYLSLWDSSVLNSRFRLHFFD